MMPVRVSGCRHSCYWALIAWVAAFASLLQTAHSAPLETHILDKKVFSIDFTPDSQTALVGTRGKVLLWDVATATYTEWLAHTGVNIQAVAFSPDGSEALSGGDDTVINRWNVATGTILATWTDHTGKITDLDWSPDGTKALSASEDTTVKYWDVSAGTVLATWDADFTTVVGAARLSPDGTQALVATYGPQKDIKKMDVASGTCLATWTGHTYHIETLVYSADGTKAVSCAWDNTCRKWDVATGA